MGMTIKKAKAIVKGITDKIDCNTVDIDDWAEFWGFTREEYEEFLDMSIKAITNSLMGQLNDDIKQRVVWDIDPYRRKHIVKLRIWVDTET